MQNKYIKFLIIFLAIVIVVPQVALASWWNPFSWGIWNRVFHFQQTEQQQIKEQCKKENEDCGYSFGKAIGNCCEGLKCDVESNIPDAVAKCNKANIVGGDKDAHGCIGSAGYTWCEVKQKCLRSWEEKCEAAGLSEESVVEAVESLEKVKLKKNASGYYEYSSLPQGFSINIDSITFGDINGDGVQDAFVHITTCGGSCGSGFIVVIGKIRATYDVFSVIPEGFISSSAAQYGVKSISIANGIIFIDAEVSSFDGSSSTVTLKYKISGKNLVKVN